MNAEYLDAYIIPAAFALLPERMNSDEARGMLIAIALQESRLKHRRQIRGPARGFWQFEAGGGVKGVMTHPATAKHASAALKAMRYGKPSVSEVHDIIEHHDIVACVFARLNLWWLPYALPEADDMEGGWDQYIAAWRPGRPNHPAWERSWREAWSVVA